MAVFPERIVLKTSSDTQQDIVDQIKAGGSDPIIRGELVLGTAPGSVRLYAADEVGAIVQFGGSDATTVASLTDVDLAGVANNYVLKFDSTDNLWKASINSFKTLSDVTEVNNILDVNLGGVAGVKFGSAEILTDGNDTKFRGVLNQYLSFGDNGALLQSEKADLTIASNGNDTDNDGNTIFYDAKIILESGGSIGKHASISAPSSLVEDTSFILPPDNGSTGWALVSDGNGRTSWASSPAVDLSGTFVSELANISVASATTGQGMYFDGANWIPYDFKDTVYKLDDVLEYDTDDIVNPNNGYKGLFFLSGGLKLKYASNSNKNSEWVTGNFGTEIITRDGTEDHGRIGINHDIGPVVLGGSTAGSPSLNVYGYNGSPGSIRIGATSQSSIAHSNGTGANLNENTVTIKSPLITDNYALTLPVNVGATGQVLGTDASGQLGWYDTFPPVGNGLIEFTATISGSGLIELAGLSRLAGNALTAPLTIYPGLQYRIDNQTGFNLTIADLAGNAYNEGIVSNGSTDQIIAWTVQADVPQDLALVSIQDGTATALLPIVAQSYTANISRDVLNELSDVDTASNPPLDNFGLVYENGKWVPKPVFSQEGQAYLPSIRWNSLVGLNAVPSPLNPPDTDGEWSYGYIASGINTINIYGTSANGQTWNTVFDDLITESQALWMRIETTNVNNVTNQTGLIPVTSFTSNGTSYTIAWNDNITPFPFPGNSSATALKSIVVRLIEKVVINVPVLSVNGLPSEAEPNPNVIIDVEKIDDVYFDNPNSIDNGFPYNRGSATNDGKYEVTQRGQDYDLTISNVDSLGVNRRPMMLSGDVPQVRPNGSGVFVQLGASQVDLATNSVIFRNITTEAQGALAGNVNNLVYLKFQNVQTDGYLLEEGSLLSYNLADKLWKPRSTEAGEVTSVNGQSGDVNLNLNSLDGVNVVTAIPGVALVFNGTDWAPGTVNASINSLNDIADVSVENPENGQVLAWSILDNSWVAQDSTITDGTVTTINGIVPNSAGEVTLGLGGLAGVALESVAEGLSLEIGLLDQIKFDSSTIPASATAKIYWSSVYGLSFGTYSSTESAVIHTDLEYGIGLKSTSAVRLMGLTGTDNTPVLSFDSGNKINGTSGYSVSFTIPSITKDTAYVLPAEDGADGEILSTDGTGALSWVENRGVAEFDVISGGTFGT